MVLPRPFGDNVTRSLLATAHNIVKIPSTPRELDETRAALSRQRIDVLIVADDGIDPFVYTLLHSRIAPVQVWLGTCWIGAGCWRVRDGCVGGASARLYMCVSVCVCGCVLSGRGFMGCRWCTLAAVGPTC